MLLFEALVDVYNRQLAADPRLPAIVRRINQLHHRDEARHLAFGRQHVADLTHQFVPGWSVAERNRIAAGLEAYVDGLWLDLGRPELFRDLGLDAPYEVSRDAVANLRARRAWIAETLAFLDSLGLGATS